MGKERETERESGGVVGWCGWGGGGLVLLTPVWSSSWPGYKGLTGRGRKRSWLGC